MGRDVSTRMVVRARAKFSVVGENEGTLWWSEELEVAVRERENRGYGSVV